MAEQYVVRIPRADAEDSAFVLINATKKGPSPLDLRLVGTENAGAYVATVKQKSVSKLRASDYDGSPEDWQSILANIILGEPPLPSQIKSVEGVEAVAFVKDEVRINLVLRRNISGIMKKLGEINLESVPLEKEPVELFDWAEVSAQNNAVSRKEISDLKEEADSQRTTINRLNHQLEELIQAKKEQEDSMLEKFKNILNSKKLKIRNQQRLLGDAKVDQSKAEKIQTKRKGDKETTSRRAGPSRSTKRKAVKPQSSETDGEDGFMEVDAPQKGSARVSEEGEEPIETATPDRSEAENVIDDEDTTDDEEVQQVGRSSIETTDKVPARLKRSEESKDPKADQPPPRRELPFDKKEETRQTRSKKPESPKADENATDETGEETEDEL